MTEALRINRTKQALAFLSLAKAQCRFAGSYASWAREAESIGNRDAQRRYRAEADRLREDARWHLGMARRLFPHD